MARVKNIETILDLPSFVSMRKSALKIMGGDLDTLYEVPRWDGAGESRARSRHNCHKDHMEQELCRIQIRRLLGKE